jgi:hypothetical protein
MIIEFVVFQMKRSNQRFNHQISEDFSLHCQSEAPRLNKSFQHASRIKKQLDAERLT